LYSPPPLSSYGMMGAGMMGAGMPYYGGALMGPFSGLYQVLFGIQNVIFSLTQAVQLIGTNQQALQHALDSVTKMADAAIATFYELRALEAQKEYTPEQQRRRKRLQALRWALVTGGTWLVYKIVRRLTSKQKRLANYPYPQSYGSITPYQQQGYGGYGFMGSSSNFGGSGYGGFGGGGVGYM
jgi:VIT1/CCC1 family predicted Fe2+/Mn2+ transporter